MTVEERQKAINYAKEMIKQNPHDEMFPLFLEALERQNKHRKTARRFKKKYILLKRQLNKGE